MRPESRGHEHRLLCGYRADSRSKALEASLMHLGLASAPEGDPPGSRIQGSAPGSDVPKRGVRVCPPAGGGTPAGRALTRLRLSDFFRFVKFGH
jgi:hypothetical protein